MGVTERNKAGREMSRHKEIYFKAFGYTPGDFIASEVSGALAVDVHAIIADGMGGRPNKDTHRIENLIALTREEHKRYGEAKEWKAWLFKMHRIRLEDNGIPHDKAWIQEQIDKYEN